MREFLMVQVKIDSTQLPMVKMPILAISLFKISFYKGLTIIILIL